MLNQLFSEFTDSIASRNDQVEVFKELDKITRQLIGHKLFTLMSVDQIKGEAARIYSNMPDSYLISGKKPIPENIWTKQVLVDHQTFVANDIDAIAEVFDDHQLIQSLGCESVINVPIVVGGNVIGTINCLAEAGHYGKDKIIDSQALRLPGAACFLLDLVLKG